MTDAPAELAGRLQRMRWVATSLVIAMAVLFVVTSFLRGRYPPLNLVWAFSEAALIGGLADWFAVSALFRHPLGLPIPHTAIVPNRKDDIGRALADFIARHFLVREVVAARLADADLAARLGEWMRRPENAAALSRDLGIALEWLLRGAETGTLGRTLAPSLHRLAETIPPHRIMATVVDVVVSGNHAQSLIDELVLYGRSQLERHKASIRERIRDRSPWWLPRFVDEEIYDQLVTELERILSEVGDDPTHEARAALNERLRALKHDFGHDPDLIAKGIALRQELLEHPEVNRFLHELWDRAREYLEHELADPDSDIRRGVATEIRSLGESLSQSADDGGEAANPLLRERVNQWLVELVIYIVERYREPISRIVSETVAQWDPKATSERIELQIGPDLQFIRINGTIVGGFVGVALYLVWSGIVG